MEPVVLVVQISLLKKKNWVLNHVGISFILASVKE